MSNELDLPQVSIARYLELLKRRWWQVIPVTLLGLVAGAVAAFLIPRYYVAKTVFTFKGGEVLDPKSREDPMTAVATNAQLSIPPLAEEAMLELGWPEAVDEDPERRRKFIKSVEERINVFRPFTDLGLNQINLTIFYKDINGERAANFANKIRDVWTEGERERIEADARREKELLNQEVTRLEIAKRSKEASLRNHVELHRDVLHGLITSQREGRQGNLETRDPNAVERSSILNQLTSVAGEIARLEGDIGSLQAELQSGNLKPKVIEIEPGAVDPVEDARFEKSKVALEDAKKALDALQPGTSKHKFRQILYDKALTDFQTALEERNRSRQVEKDNPLYLAMFAQVAEKRSALSGLLAQRSVLQKRLDVLESESTRWPSIWRTYETLSSELQSILDKLEVANQEQRAALQNFSRLKNSRRFRTVELATVPPRPTDPNILLVAVLGSLIGLATAIGLILLLDFLQSAFKTVDDVERALPVPVLGTMAHLQTQEERVTNVTQRRRVSLAAGVLLFLSLSVITIYFVDPTKLPPPVMNLLDMLLGEPPK